MPVIARPDYETALPPLDARETAAVIELLIDVHHGGERQAFYSDRDRAWMHALLDERLANAR
jgi:hypothetical protein